MKILSRQNVQSMDQMALKGIKLIDLIEEVGGALASAIVQIYKPCRVLVLCGPGNNGCDGLAMAKDLAQRKFKVSVYCLNQGKTKNKVFATLLKKVNSLQVTSVDFNDYDLVIDGLYGTGLDRELDRKTMDLLQKANHSSVQRVAIDIPTGVDADNGRVWGEAFCADHTLTVQAYKRGLVLLPGALYAGEVTAVPVKSLSKFENKLIGLGEYNYIGTNWKESILPTALSHKYNRGHISFLMGDQFPGAALMAAMAAQKAGAGYVQLYVPERLTGYVQVRYPQFVVHPYGNIKNLLSQLLKDKASTMVLGPGWTKSIEIFFKLFKQKDKNIVLDGGFLKKELLSPKNLKLWPTKNFVITPHEGELNRLVTDKSQTKWNKVEAIGKKFEGVVVAKGYDTIIGSAHGYRIYRSSPFLATAGSGDVLAGLIGSFIAQGMAPYEAASFAVCIHCRIGHSYGWGLTAPDIIKTIPVAIESLGCE